MSSPESLSRRRSSSQSSNRSTNRSSDDDEPEEKITLEEIEAELPPYYKEVIGEILIGEKSGDEDEEVDIETVPEKSHNININTSRFKRIAEEYFTNLLIIDKTGDQNEEIDVEQMSDNSNKRKNDSSNEETDLEESAQSDDRVVQDLNDDSEELFDGNFDDLYDENVEENSKDVEEDSEENPEENMIVDDDSDNAVEEDVDEMTPEKMMKLRAEYAKKLQVAVKKHQAEQALLAYEKRVAFSKTERDILVFYLIANNKITKAKGRDIWQFFIDDGYLPNRTQKSIWNHIMNHLIPAIETLELPKVFKDEFLKLKEKKTRNRTKTINKKVKL